MTIWATPFKANTLQHTGPSADSGFESVEQAVAALGPGHVKRTRQMVVYGEGEDHVVFSALIFRVDGPVTNG